MYQVFYPLLSRSLNPKFFVSSTVSASTGLLDQIAAFPQLGYGMSKAAVNNLTRRIHFENSTITAVPFHPGTSLILTITDIELCWTRAVPTACVG